MSSTKSAGRAKRGLLIGIDKYPWLNPLEGCVNDARLMHKVLQDHFGFPAANLNLLVDGQATRDSILNSLDDLVAQTGSEDIVVIHYAGHGSQMTDREGDEPDGLDETIMPFDSQGRWGDNRDITDDEIHLRLLRLAEKTSYITLIFDSCHSGSITRDSFGAKSRSVEADTRPISELPPSPIPESARPPLGSRGPSGWMPVSNAYVLLAGCRDDETSFEYRPPEGEGALVHGALTYFLAQQLRQAVPGTTYRDVFERAAAGVHAAYSKQHPQMEGRGDREVFGVTEIEPMRHVRVNDRAGANVTLAAGAAHGMTIGSTWSIYPQGTKRPEAIDQIGEVVITSVRAVTSQARVAGEKSPNAVAKEMRAVETIHDYGDLRLKVQLIASHDHPQVTALKEHLTASPLLEVIEEANPAAARIYLLAPRNRVNREDPVPQLPVIHRLTLAVVGAAGELLMPPSTVDAAMDVLKNLEKLARYRQALALENPDSGSRLRDKFTLQLLRKTAEGKWVVAEPETAGGQVVFEEGENVAFRVTSQHSARMYLNLLDFGLGGGVSLVYPAGGAQETLAPGVSFEYGTREGDEQGLEIPEAFPYTGELGSSNSAEGLETVKLILTTEATDFSFLEQPGFAPTKRRESSPLTLLFDTAMGRTATREVKKKVSLRLAQEDWITISKTFVLRRREAVDLDPNGSVVRLGDASIRTPGLAGRGKSYVGKSGRAEAEELTAQALTNALDKAGVDVEQTIEVFDPSYGESSRGVRGEPTIQLEVPDPGTEYGQMVLTTNELGVVAWHFAPSAREARAGTRGDMAPVQVRSYLIPSPRPADGTGAPTSRSLVGTVGRKFLKVLVFPLIEPGIGRITESYAGQWEEKHRPYRARAFGPNDYSQAEALAVNADAWKRLGSGRALLMIHGTFGRAHTAFGALPREFVERMYRQYQGRVFALDHYTLSHDPKQNVGWLLEQLPEGTSLDLDIICHSRGGLVSRVLSEKQGELAMGSRRVKVGRVVFVGAPNAGTILADADHVGDFLDTYTNILNFIPDAGLGDVLAGIITVAKHLAIGAVKGLSGLQSMRPGAEFGKWLNTGARGEETRYFALASNYTPKEPGLKELAKDRLLDKIFKVGNDLVVPTDGVFSANGSGFFPIEQKLVFQGSDAVAHTGYFGSTNAREKIAEWLAGAS